MSIIISRLIGGFVSSATPVTDVVIDVDDENHRMHVYVVNAAPVLTPSSVVTAQPPSYEEACENPVTSQPMKS